MKSIIIVFVICLLTVQVSFANNLNNELNKVIESGWTLSECYSGNYKENITNIVSMKYNDNIEKCALYISENKLNDEFKKAYKEMDIYNKTLVNPVIDILKENKSEPVEYPGYGFADPDYNYRRGMELDRKVLNSFWRKEKRILEKEQVNDLTIELSLLAEFTAGMNFEILGNLNIKINGEIKKCVKIRVSFKETVEISCITKYQKTKVWNELLWKKKGTNNSWEKCGKTYRVIEESSDETIATDAPMPR